ncbi:hypothetical protein D3C84_1280390 [compost metagenome]
MRLLEAGKIEVPIAALAVTDIGKLVYASDSGTFSLSAAGNSLIGHIHRFVSGGVGIVKYSAQAIPAV